MKKFAFIGAGSFVFTRNLVVDLLTFPSFDNCEIALMDIDRERLDLIGKVCDRINEKMGTHAKITRTMDRREALAGADGVVCTVFNGDMSIWRQDIEIPMKYGVDVCVGDTRNVAGIFRALRNIPLMLDICRDIEECCPNAVFLNYTNPMSILCKAMQTYSKVNVTGLCHSVQGTPPHFAKILGIPAEEIDYTCVGINHMAFFTKVERNGKDLYPELKEKMLAPGFYETDKVKHEVMKHLGYFVTESSGHFSEYVQWFRKRPDLIEKYCVPAEGQKGGNPGEHAYSIKVRSERNWREDFSKIWNDENYEYKKSPEYGADIFNACFGDGKPFKFNGNVINEGCVTNLPYDACVEIPVYASRSGFEKVYVGAMPEHLAILVSTTARIENLVVEAAMEKSREKVFQAVCLDPLSSAVCSLEEIKHMTDELFEKNKDFLGDYK